MVVGSGVGACSNVNENLVSQIPPGLRRTNTSPNAQIYSLLFCFIDGALQAEEMHVEFEVSQDYLTDDVYYRLEMTSACPAAGLEFDPIKAFESKSTHFVRVLCPRNDYVFSHDAMQVVAYKFEHGVDRCAKVHMTFAAKDSPSEYINETAIKEAHELLKSLKDH